MGIINKLDELRQFYETQIKTEIDKYVLVEPIPTPSFILSECYRDDIVKSYREFSYPEDYIKMACEELFAGAGTAATMIPNKTMGESARIVVSAKYYPSKTFAIQHELIHASDFYNYCKRHNLLNISYLELMKLPDFQSLLLFSEFRAHYECALKENELALRVRHEEMMFGFNLEIIKSTHNLMGYYYFIIAFLADYCACCERFPLEFLSLNELYPQNAVAQLFGFLFPIRKKSPQQLENNFAELMLILSNTIEQRG